MQERESHPPQLSPAMPPPRSARISARPIPAPPDPARPARQVLPACRRARAASGSQFSGLCAEWDKLQTAAAQRGQRDLRATRRDSPGPAGVSATGLLRASPGRRPDCATRRGSARSLRAAAGTHARTHTTEQAGRQAGRRGAREAQRSGRESHLGARALDVTQRHLERAERRDAPVADDRRALRGAVRDGDGRPALEGVVAAEERVARLRACGGGVRRQSGGGDRVGDSRLVSARRARGNKAGEAAAVAAAQA